MPADHGGIAPAANLQSPVQLLAETFGVSVRSIYMAQRLRRLRPDLGERVLAGELSLHAALRIAEGRSKPTSWDRLVTAWNSATPADRERLLDQLLPIESLGAADD